MSGETDLAVLLKSMEPELGADDYVPAETAAWAVISEEEGKTLILKKELADRNGIPFETVFKRITLKVHSSLESVGLTAKVSAKLASLGICANVVAGYYHDHIFVRREQADRALAGLKDLSRERIYRVS